MPELAEGQTLEVRGSGARTYQLKHIAGVYSCTCPAWRNQSLPIDRRTCKHLRRLRSDAAEAARLGGTLAPISQPAAVKPPAPPLLLAETWTESVDPSGWWLSEKLDGVRAWWDGARFVSRNGNPYYAPAWFTAGLPNVPLDGELWIGRKEFSTTVAIVRRQDGGDLWRRVRFVVFDAPEVNEAIEARQQALRDLLPAGHSPFATVLDQTRCQNRHHLAAELARIEALGGEGVMLRQPGSLYVPSRSTTLLKVKSFHDVDAVVVGHQPGTGRHRGRLGALLVQLPNGAQCAVGTGLTDAERERPPAIGSVITLKYQELTSAGVPRFPVFVRERSDHSLHFHSARFAKGTLLVPTTALQDGARRFEYVQENSCKFWEFRQSGHSVIVRYGRIGAAGQTVTKSFPDAIAAARHAEKLVREKTGKGYVETMT